MILVRQVVMRSTSTGQSLVGVAAAPAWFPALGGWSGRAQSGRRKVRTGIEGRLFEPTGGHPPRSAFSQVKRAFGHSLAFTVVGSDKLVLFPSLAVVRRNARGTCGRRDPWRRQARATLDTSRLRSVVH